MTSIKGSIDEETTEEKIKTLMETIMKKDHKDNLEEFVIGPLRKLGILSLIVGGILYADSIFQYKTIDLTSQIIFSKTERLLKEQHINKVNSNYERLKSYYLNPNSTKQDTFDYYMEQGLGKCIEFNEPSFEDKEKILERMAAE